MAITSNQNVHLFYGRIALDARRRGLPQVRKPAGLASVRDPEAGLSTPSNLVDSALYDGQVLAAGAAANVFGLGPPVTYQGRGEGQRQLLPIQTDSTEQMLARVEKALEQATSTGGNCTFFHTGQHPEPAQATLERIRTAAVV